MSNSRNARLRVVRGDIQKPSPKAAYTLFGLGQREGQGVLFRDEINLNDALLLTWMRRPTSAIGGKADMARTCQYVR